MDTALQLDPLASDIDIEFDTEESPDHYDAWFHARVAEALADKDGFLPHHVAMAEVDAMLIHRRAQRAAG